MTAVINRFQRLRSPSHQNFELLWRMCSAVRWEANTRSRDYCDLNHLCLRYLIYVGHALLQMLAHSCYHRKWHSADLLQETFYSEPLLADSSCWIGMTVSSARSYPDLFQKRKTKTNIDANFGIIFNCYISKPALHHIRKKRRWSQLLPSSLSHPFYTPTTLSSVRNKKLFRRS